jgi:hypothetical protein
MAACDVCGPCGDVPAGAIIRGTNSKWEILCRDCWALPLHHWKDRAFYPSPCFWNMICSLGDQAAPMDEAMSVILTHLHHTDEASQHGELLPTLSGGPDVRGERRAVAYTRGIGIRRDPSAIVYIFTDVVSIHAASGALRRHFQTYSVHRQIIVPGYPQQPAHYGSSG